MHVLNWNMKLYTKQWLSSMGQFRVVKLYGWNTIYHLYVVAHYYNDPFTQTYIHTCTHSHTLAYKMTYSVMSAWISPNPSILFLTIKSYVLIFRYSQSLYSGAKLSENFRWDLFQKLPLVLHTRKQRERAGDYGLTLAFYTPPASFCCDCCNLTFFQQDENVFISVFPGCTKVMSHKQTAQS